MADIIVVKQNVAEKVSVNPAPVTVTGILLAPATNTTLGGIIVGDNLTITGNGVLSAQPGGVTGFNNRTGNVSLTANDVTTALTYTPLAPLGNVTHSNSLLIANTTAYMRGDVYQSASGLQVYYGAAAGGSTVEPDSFRAGAACGTRDLYFRTSGSTASFGSSYLTNNATASIQAGLSASYNACMSVTGGDLYSGLTARVQALNTKTAVGQITGNIAVSKFVVVSNSISPEMTLATNGTNSQALLTVPDTLPIVYSANSILTQGYADARYQAVGSYLTTTSASSTYSPIIHSHAISDVTGLQTALDGKQASGAYILDSDSRLTDARTPLAHNQAWSTITGTPTTLSGYGITDGYSSSNPAGYITSACLTYSNITNTPTPYSLPTANTTVLGGVKVDGTSVTVSNGTISVSTAYAGTGSNSFTGSQNLQDNELIRAKIRDYSETVSSPTISAGTLVLNLETSNIFTVSLNAAITTLTISNPPASGSGGSFTLILTADGAARAVTWPASIKWAGGTAPTLTSTSGKVDSFAFFTSDGGTTWQGYVGGQNF